MILAGLLLGLPTAAEEPPSPRVEPSERFRHLGVEDGLSHDSVYALLQDADGFVWLGTEDGLDRYDGYRFVHLDQSRIEGLPSRDISYLMRASDGAVWVATWGGGVVRYDPATGLGTVLRHRPDRLGSLSEDRSQFLLEDAEGRIWIGTYEGLDRLDRLGEDLRHYREDAAPGVVGGLPADRIWAIAECPRDRLWVATEEGLALLDPATDRIRAFGVGEGPEGLFHHTVRTLACDSRGRLWVGTEEGLQRTDPAALAADFDALIRFDRWRNDPADSTSLSQDTINVVLEDRRGRIWVGTQHGGLNLLRADGSFRRFASDPADPDSLGHFDVRALWEDRSGVLWVATRGGGVSLLDLTPPKFERAAFRSTARRARDETIASIEEDGVGGFWLGTDRGLVHWTPATGEKRFVRHDPLQPDSLSPDSVRALHRDPDGTLWVGTFNGLDRLRPGVDPPRFEHVASEADDHRDREIEDILRRRDGSLWVGTRGGVSRLDPEADRLVQVLREEDGLADERTWVLHEDDAGRLWIGSDDGGLARLDPDGSVRAWRHRGEPDDELGDDRVLSIATAPDGRLWLGTAGGLGLLDPESGALRWWYASDGLPSGVVQCLLTDPRGDLWLSTNRGLARLRPASGEILTYDESDGLQGLLFTQGACTKTADGRLVFGGFEGLNLVEPDEIRDNPVAPPVVLTDFSVFHQPRENGVPIHRREAIELAWHENFFSFEFAALDFRNPGRNRYAYLLEGIDPAWVEAGPRRYAGYTKVPPGDYVFRVRAASSDGVWNEEGTSVAIRIVPPFWQTAWFRIGSVLALVLAASAFHWLRLRSIRRRAEELEVEVARRTAELRASKEELARQHKRLEVVNGIVQLINAETDFGDLLSMILEGVAFAEGAEKALAMVRDKPSGLYDIRAAFGWTEGVPAVLALTRDEIEREYLGAAQSVQDGVWIGAAGEGRLRAEEEKLGRPSRVILALRIDIGLDVAGYLVFGKTREGEGFSSGEAEVLADLQQHVASAFRKGRLLEELRALNEKKNEFLGVAAHDLRSPLGGVISYTDLLLRFLEEQRDDPAIWKRFLTNVRTTAAQMQTLVNNLLDVTAIESGKLDLQVSRSRLEDLVEERAGFHERAAAAKSIELEVDTAELDAEVLVDRVRIGEVVDNLVGNAIKFTTPGGRVRVFGDRDADEIRVHVEDTGQGLLDHELSLLFEGRRLSAQPTGGERSTGLGLVIVKKIVELHRGRVWAQSSKGEGSTFSFALPRVDVEQREESA